MVGSKEIILCCPECGSTKLTKFGKKWVSVEGKRIRKQQLQCQNCGRVTINPKETNE